MHESHSDSCDELGGLAHRRLTQQDGLGRLRRSGLRPRTSALFAIAVPNSRKRLPRSPAGPQTYSVHLHSSQNSCAVKKQVSLKADFSSEVAAACNLTWRNCELSAVTDQFGRSAIRRPRSAAEIFSRDNPVREQRLRCIGRL